MPKSRACSVCSVACPITTPRTTRSGRSRPNAERSFRSLAASKRPPSASRFVVRECRSGAPITFVVSCQARWAPVDKRAARRSLGIAEDEFVVVYIGRIHPNKGVDLLVEAVRSLVSRMQRLRVFAIGPLGDDQAQTEASPYAAKVMDRAKGLPVQFTGFIANQSERFRAYLAVADVAVFPSR